MVCYEGDQLSPLSFAFNALLVIIKNNKIRLKMEKFELLRQELKCKHSRENITLNLPHDTS